MPTSKPRSKPLIPTHRRLNLTAGAVSLAIVLAAVFVPMPYAVEMPGPLSNVLGKTEIHDGTKSSAVDMIEIDGQTSYPATGELNLTTVSVRGGPGFAVTLPELVSAWLNPNYSITPVENVFPRELSRAEVKQANTLQMTQSQDQATLNALDVLGIKYGTIISIGSVSSDSPNFGTVKVGDIITGIDDQTFATSDELIKYVKTKKPGESLVFKVTRADKPLELTLKTYEVEGSTRIGIGLALQAQMPFTVKIRIEDVGGPSAGTMFALGIIDKLTEGNLTGGLKIAGTGTQEINGFVGPIGGIHQKMLAAHDAGIKYFLIPADNCREALPEIPEGMTGVKITTLKDALNSVQIIATQKDLDKLPRCTS